MSHYNQPHGPYGEGPYGRPVQQQQPAQPQQPHQDAFNFYQSAPNSYGQMPYGSHGQVGYGPYGHMAGHGHPSVAGNMDSSAAGRSELSVGWWSAFSTEGYSDEPPLLEELGVNFSHIKSKTLTVLNPFKEIDSHLMDDTDLAGPILFAIMFGFLLRASGNVHFGYVYGLSLLGSTSLHVILSLMSPPPRSSTIDPSMGPQGMGAAIGPDTMGVGSTTGYGSSRFESSLTYLRSASMLGYCLLPLVLTSVLGVVMPMDSTFGYALTSVAIGWCTYSATAMFCAIGQMKQMRALVAYPLALFYICFGIMSIFSSRGAGSAARSTYISASSGPTGGINIVAHPGGLAL